MATINGIDYSNPYNFYSSGVSSTPKPSANVASYTSGVSYASPQVSSGSVLGTSTSSKPDLSNPVKQTDYAHSKGFDTWEMYLDSLNESQPKAWEPDLGAYFSELDKVSGLFGNSADAQRGMVGNQYQQGVNTLTSQRDVGLRDLGSERVKTEESQTRSMRDLAEAMRNQFMSGQVMLGARGAGDSSAVDQYSYALTKLGNKQRGDLTTQTAGIMNDISDREFKLKTEYDNNLRTIAEERDGQLNQIASWLAEQQAQIGQMKAQGKASIAEAAYNQAMNWVNQANTMAQNKSAALDQWAMNNATTINQLKSNLANVSNYSANPTAFQGLNTNLTGSATPQANSMAGYGSFGSEDENRGIFGR